MRITGENSRTGTVFVSRTRDDIRAGIRCPILSEHWPQNNTLEYKTVEYWAIRLHETDVVRKYFNGDIVLNSGGWDTRTTRDRINGYIRRVGASVYTTFGDMWIQDSTGDHKVFKDGVTLNAEGKFKRR